MQTTALHRQPPSRFSQSPSENVRIIIWLSSDLTSSVAIYSFQLKTVSIEMTRRPLAVVVHAKVGEGEFRRKIFAHVGNCDVVCALAEISQKSHDHDGGQ
jgi:hypothetical protein